MPRKLEITQMPPLPTVMLQLIRFDPSNPENDAEALERLLQPDKGATADVLRIANSAYYGRSGKIKDLRGAITLMGVKGVKNLVVLLSTKNLQGKLKGDAFKTHLTLFPILSALIAVDLSKPAGHVALRDDAFVGALLAKMGMTVIALNDQVGYQSVLEQGAQPLAAAERAEFETDHIAVGGELFALWKLPEQLVSILNEHARPAAEVSDPLPRLVGLCMQYSARMLGLVALYSEERVAELEQSLAISGDVSAGFGADYFENIKQHPFYEQAAG